MNKEETPKLSEIFEEPTFRKIFPKLFSSPISVTQLEKETGVSRTTIYKLFKYLNPYIRVETYLGKKDKFYYFTTDIVVDYLNEKLQLDNEEKYVLKEFLNNENVKPVKKNIQSFEDFMFRLVILFCGEKINRSKLKTLPTFSSINYLRKIPWLGDLTPEEHDNLLKTIQSFSKNETFSKLIDKILNAGGFYFTLRPVDFSLFFMAVYNATALGDKVRKC